MYTECPSCHTFFKVSPPQLKVAQGRVRCGRCDTVFNAIESLAEEVPSTSSPVSSNDEFENLDLQSQFADGQEASLADVEIPGMETDEDAGLGLVEDELEAAGAPVEEEVAPDIAGDLPGSEFDLDEDLFSTPAVPEDDALGEMIGEDVASELDAGDGLGGLDLAGDLEAEPAAGAIDDELAMSELDLDEAVEPEVDAGDFEAPADDAEQLGDVFEELAEEPAAEVNAEDDFGLDLADEATPDMDQAPAAVDLDSTTEMEMAEMEQALDEMPDESPIMPDAEIEEDVPSAVAREESQFEAVETEPESAEDYVLKELDDSETASRSWLATIFWVLLITLLLLVLLGQFAYFKRAELAQQPQLKPYLEKMCEVINPYVPCDIPAPRDLDAIQLLERDVRTHPSSKGALLITSTIISKAAFEQPFPKLELTFSDINEKTLARRVFKPAEYLSDDVEIEKGLTPDLPIRIMLEIVDPGPEAVNFEFTFK